MVSEGEYRAKAVSLGIKRAGTGTKFVAVSFRLEEGPNKGQLVEWQGWLSPKAKARTADALDAMGFDGERLESCKSEVTIVLENEEYRGEDGRVWVKPRVKWVNSLNRGAGFGEELDKAELQETMGELRGLHAGAKKPQTANTSFDFNDDDNLAF